VPKINTPIPNIDWTTERTAITAITVRKSAVINLPADPAAHVDIRHYGEILWIAALPAGSAMPPIVKELPGLYSSP
jgi:hypothetical protein